MFRLIYWSFFVFMVCFSLFENVSSRERKLKKTTELNNTRYNDHKEVKKSKQSSENQRRKIKKLKLAKTKSSEGERRQFLGPENLAQFQGPPLSHVIEKPLFHHQVHYVPKPFPVMSVQFVPKPLPVPFGVPPDYHVSHLHMRHPYHLNPCQGGGIWVRLPHDYFCICPKQLRGKNCEAHKYCSSEPCMNGATCVETADSFRCVCPKGFLGVICEDPNPCYPSPCRNGGTCTKTDSESGFLCECKEGFTGEHCEGFNRCNPNPCKNGGSCQQIQGEKYVCVCPANFKGTLCTEPSQCYVNPCLNGGTCHESETGYKCSCRVGYTGSNCESHVCHPSPCHHGGHCSVDSGHYKCVCPPLFRGHVCEVPHPCYNHPCENDGICVDSYSGYSAYPENWDSGYLHYLCLCKPGFMGANCEQDICKHCDVNAKCLNDTCICIDGYFGDGFHCRKIPHPCHPNPCKNNGVCKELEGGEYDCKCQPGTTGKHCEDKDPCHPNPCQNNGKCVAAEDGTTKCICEGDHTGANCELTIDPCRSNPCHNSGTCINDNGKAVCKCKGKYTGKTCKECSCPKGNKNAQPPEFSQQCDLEGDCICPYDGYVRTETGCVTGRTSTACDSSPCKNGGTCKPESETTFSCQCLNEWKGLTCEEPVCTDEYCQNNGICEARDHKPFCICQNGYFGPRCEQLNETKPIDHCHPNPCLNGGTCTPVFNSYDCRCDIQYTGAHCEVDKCAKCDVHAVCVHGRCKCLIGYIGTGYECVKVRHTHCPVTCPAYSTCTQGSCQCIPGYVMTAGQCQPPQPQCPTPCPAYSTCTQGTCHCNPGYTMNGGHCARISVYALTDGEDEEEEEEEETPTPSIPPTVTAFPTNSPTFPTTYPSSRPPPPKPTQPTSPPPVTVPVPGPAPVPQPVPEPSPEPAPVPEPVPEPSPEPAPVPEPVPVPAPVPEPVPVPAPVPEPVPVPAPVPEPVPVPAPVPEPVPVPAPVPEPVPVPAPVPVPVPSPVSAFSSEDSTFPSAPPPINPNALADAVYNDDYRPPKPGVYKSSVAQQRAKHLAALKYRNARLNINKYAPKPSYYKPRAMARNKYHNPLRVQNMKYPPRPSYYTNYNTAAASPGQGSVISYYHGAPVIYNYPPVYLGGYPQPYPPTFYRYERYGRG